MVYTTGAGDSWERATAAWHAKRWNGYVEERDYVQCYRSGKFDVRWRKVKTWDQWALRRHARKLMELAGWSTASHRIAYVFHPTFWPYIEHLGDCTVVYHADDAFSLMPGWNGKSQAMESKLVARANLLLATSPGVAQQLQTVQHSEHDPSLMAPWLSRLWIWHNALVRQIYRLSLIHASAMSAL